VESPPATTPYHARSNHYSGSLLQRQPDTVLLPLVSQFYFAFSVPYHTHSLLSLTIRAFVVLDVDGLWLGALVENADGHLLCSCFCVYYYYK